jgi:hypothetical protein
VPRTAFYFIPSAMTGFIVSVFPFRNRVSSKEAFEGLELGEGKPSRPVLRGPGGRKAAWLLGSYFESEGSFWEVATSLSTYLCSRVTGKVPHSTCFKPRFIDTLSVGIWAD